MPKKILVFGTFDHFHPGHASLLSDASSRGDVFVVVARDETVQRIKGHTPDQSVEERMAAVREAFPEAIVVLGDSSDYMVPVREIAPDLILLGYDQRMPPGVQEEDLPCEVLRAEAHEPEKWKSSLRQPEKGYS